MHGEAQPMFLALDEYLGKDEATIKAEIVSDYEIKGDGDPATLIPADILVAWMTDGGYDSQAFHLLRDAEGYLVNHSSHCSCFGYEEQWEPERTTLEALKRQAEKGEFIYDEGSNAMIVEFVRALPGYAEAQA